MMVYFPLIAFSVSNYAKISPKAGRKGRKVESVRFIPLLNNKETDFLFVFVLLSQNKNA